MVDIGTKKNRRNGKTPMKRYQIILWGKIQQERPEQFQSVQIMDRKCNGHN